MAKVCFQNQNMVSKINMCLVSLASEALCVFSNDVLIDFAFWFNFTNVPNEKSFSEW